MRRSSPRSRRSVRVRSAAPVAPAAARACSVTARYSAARAARIASAIPRSWAALPGVASHTVEGPAGLDDLLGQPVELLAGAGVGGQRDEAVAQPGHPETFQLAPHSDPGVGGLARAAGRPAHPDPNRAEPAGGAGPATATSVSMNA